MIGHEARLHLTGAAGTGTTTLGRYLADYFDVPHVDTDDFYWLSTDPPFTSKRPVSERVEMMRQARGCGGWIISGSLAWWGDRVIESADLIVFLTARTSVRLARLRQRERKKFGQRIAKGGDMARNHAAFLNWAASYDSPMATGRSRSSHEAWLDGLDIPVLRLTSDRAVSVLAQDVEAALSERPNRDAQ